MIAHRETAELAEQFIADTIDKQNIVPGTLTLHADRGTSMRSKSVAQLLVDLDVTKTHNRPHVSDDNPYSEAHFKTLKYRPDFPARFGSTEDARAHCQEFFRWYSTEHRHSGIALMPPDAVHYGLELSRNPTGSYCSKIKCTPQSAAVRRSSLPFNAISASTRAVMSSPTPKIDSTLPSVERRGINLS